MERDDTTRDAAAEQVEHDQPAQPEQTGDEGFENGQERPGSTPEEEREPNFARGQSAEHVPGTEEQRRFSEGQEDLPPDDPEKNVERRFSEGQEESPTST